MVRQIDITTGEILEAGTVVYVADRLKLRGWIMTFQQSFVELAKAGLKGQEWNVFAYLLGHLDWENYVHLRQADVCRELQMSRSNVSQIFSSLKKRGLIQRAAIGDSKGLAVYRLSPHIAWKGKVKNLEVARRRRLKLVREPKASTEGGSTTNARRPRVSTVKTP
jgi:predicted transcriptional regulator